MASVCDLPGSVPTAQQRIAEVTLNAPMAADTWRMRIAAPEIARQVVPGQFFMLRVPGRPDPLLGRPFALYDTVLNAAGEPIELEFGYLIVGKMTGLLMQLTAGSRVELWGPLGNGFPVATTEPLLMVAGGIGQTPFLPLAREVTGQRLFGSRISPQPTRVTLCYGVRSARYLAGVDQFQQTGIEVELATDDGSAGHHGYVTDLVRKHLAASEGMRPGRIYCCGPEPMMAAVARLAREAQVPCWLSLETPMACGFGACFSCVTKVRPDPASDDWDYRRVCVEGPVFRADELVLG